MNYLPIMPLKEYREIVGNLAVLTTVLQFLSGILVCKQYVVNLTTAEASPLPFICGSLSSILWLFYGLAKHDDKIVLVNTIGVTLMVSYTAVFYIYTMKKMAVIKQIILGIILVILVIINVVTTEDGELIQNELGLIASIVTLLTIAAPMSKLIHVIKVKNTECLPFPMILMSFFVSALWFIYGEIEEDMNLANVNFVGSAIALAQLSLFAMYPKKSQPTSIKGIIA